MSSCKATNAKRLTHAFLFLLALVSCAREEPAFQKPSCGGHYTYSFVPDVDASWRQASERSLRRWETLLPVQFVESPGDVCHVTFQVGEVGEELFGSAYHETGSDGRLSVGVVTLTYRPVVESLQEGVVTHEVGHLLGLSHDTDSTHRSVMWPYIQAPARVGCEDWRRACGMWSCQAACDGGGWLP